MGGDPDKDKPIPPDGKIKPDAVAMDGVLEMLTQNLDGQSRDFRPRALSSGTREELDSQDRQLRFNNNRESLGKWLRETIELLDQLFKFVQAGNTVPIPPDCDFSVLKLDVRMAAGASKVTADSRAVLETRLAQIMQHAQRLRQRLEDTTSRVLVTGDLNSGKSSLCNALLQRNILPVDQQPCTDVFCEVVDVAKNHGIEEVHAVLKGQQREYPKSESYNQFPLSDLSELVHRSDQYALLRIYLRDPRPPASSLLSNGVVDICLIDAPGLNVDQCTTEEVFGRQEEIDLVIFVVAAANQFTQSSKDFVSDTAREKSLVFVVVNQYDRIRDQQRCRERVLKQIAGLSPETHKGAGDFVHFVSSEAQTGGDGGVDPENPPHGPGTPDFDRLEASLRNFVLKKRSTSKLAPARTYLRNVLDDLSLLAKTSTSAASGDITALSKQLDELQPQIEGMSTEFTQVHRKIEHDIEGLTMDLAKQSYEHLNIVVTEIGDEPAVPWPGLLGVFGYVKETRESLVDRIQEEVELCEERARDVTATAVDAIKQLGVLHVGEQPTFSKVFQKSRMFSRRRDDLDRRIEADFSLLDIISLDSILERPLPVLTSSKQALLSGSGPWPWGVVSGALTAFSVVGGAQLALGSRALQVVATSSAAWGLSPSKVASVAAALAAIALGAWTIHELPRSIPRTLARKIAFEIDELGYVRQNSQRIAAESRKVLAVPAEDVRAAFQRQIDSRTRQRDEFERHVRDAERSAEVFRDLEQRSQKLLDEVRTLVLSDVD